MTFRCERLSKSYSIRNGAISALREVTFGAREQEFLCIVGPSGCGKTTLLKLIAGLLEPTAGRIVFEPEPAGDQLATALVFQEHHLFPWMTVLDNVAFGLEARGVRRRERRDRARALVDKVGLERFAETYPHQLSAGMRQRVGIVRAVLADPKILLMDEPFASVDAQTRRVLQDELLTIRRDLGKLVVHVTHDIEEAVLLGDRVLVMSGRPGSIREEIPIPPDRPRDLAGRNRPDVTEIKRHIWRLLEHDVRASLSTSP